MAPPLILTPAPSTANTVSWPSVFWAIAPIALNSMTQPCGTLCSQLEATQSFFFRSSPLVCLIDGISVLSSFGFYLRQSRNLHVALINTSRSRLAPPSPSVVDEDDEQSFPSNLHQLQDNELFRILLFVLGVAPQAIKLYACTGLFWTKLWASMYLISFFSLEILVLLPPRLFTFPLDTSEPAQPAMSQRTHLLLRSWQSWYPGIMMHCHLPLIYTFMILLMCFSKWYTDQISSDAAGIRGLVVVAIFFVAIIVLYNITPRFYSDEIIILILTTFLLYCCWSAPVVGVLSQTMNDSVTGALRTLIEHRMIMSLYGAMIMRTMSLAPTKRYNSGVGPAVFLSHIFVALTYYIAIYDSSTTLKPSWAEYLG